MTSSNSDKNVPTVNNVASEKAVLSGMIRYGYDAFLDVSGLVEEQTFTIDENKVVYKCLSKIFETSQNVDLTSILSAAQQLDLSEFIEKKDALNHIKHLMHYDVHVDNIRQHAKKIRKLQLARDLQNELRSIYTELSEVDGDETVTEIVSIPETQIQNACLKYIREDNSTTKLIGKDLDEYISHLKANEETEPGISSGFPIYDKAIGGGFRRGAVDLIGARAKCGKSTLADNVAVNIANRGTPVLILDTEMSQEDHWNRLLANLSGIAINDISSSKFNKEKQLIDNVEEAAEKVKEMPYHYISVAGRSFDEILGIARRWLFKHVGYNEEGRMNDCLIIYDYLKLMTSESINNNLAEFQALGFQITQLHNFCVEHDVPCLAFVQLNRDGITRESEDVISGSDRLIWLCTSFSIFKARGQEEIAEENIGSRVNRRLIPVVARHGPGMDGNSIFMRMTGELARLEEIGTKRDAERIHKEEKDGFADEEDSDQDVSDSPDREVDGGT